MSTRGGTHGQPGATGTAGTLPTAPDTTWAPVPLAAFGPSRRSHSHTPLLAWPHLPLLFSSLFLVYLSVEVGAVITDEGQLNAVASLTNTSNGPIIDDSDWAIAGDPCSGSTSGFSYITCNAEKTQILAVDILPQMPGLSFTLPSEISGLTHMTKL